MTTQQFPSCNSSVTRVISKQPDIRDCNQKPSRTYLIHKHTGTIPIHYLSLNTTTSHIGGKEWVKSGDI